MRDDLRTAVLCMYEAIDEAAEAQAAAGRHDQGRRSGITSGGHLDQIAEIIRHDLVSVGFDSNEIYDKGRRCTFPGWFRPTKNWDLLALDHGELISAIELKSISSSFGKNSNNRAEESIGSVVDAREAFKERLFGESGIPPVMGYVMVVRSCPESREVVNSSSPHFPIDPEFVGSSYLGRFRILCERLRRKSLYNAVWLVFATPEDETVWEPDPSMSYEVFIKNIEMGLQLHRQSRLG